VGIPNENFGPRWLRDYGSTNFGDIAANIAAMEEFATQLAADVQNNYAAHFSSVSAAMMTDLPVPNGFPELQEFLTVHREAQDVTHSNVYNFANGTNNFAQAAHDISTMYRGADAFSRARVSDVDSAFQKVATEQWETH
jgi:hypothetical protein